MKLEPAGTPAVGLSELLGSVKPMKKKIAKILRNLAKEVEAGKFGDTGCCMNKNSRHVDAELAEKIKSAAS